MNQDQGYLVEEDGDGDEDKDVEEGVKKTNESKKKRWAKNKILILKKGTEGKEKKKRKENESCGVRRMWRGKSNGLRINEF